MSLKHILTVRRLRHTEPVAALVLGFYVVRSSLVDSLFGKRHIINGDYDLPAELQRTGMLGYVVSLLLGSDAVVL
jgi:hypothetical protein